MDDRLLLRFVVYSWKTGLSSVKLIGTKIGWSEILKVLYREALLYGVVIKGLKKYRKNDIIQNRDKKKYINFYYLTLIWFCLSNFR